MSRFESGEKVARAGNCPSIGCLSGCRRDCCSRRFSLFAALSPRHSARVHKRSTGRCLSAAPMPTVLIKLRPTHEAWLRPIFAPAVEHLQDGIAQSLSDVADQASMVRSSLEPFRKFRTDGISLGRISGASCPRFKPMRSNLAHNFHAV